MPCSAPFWLSGVDLQVPRPDEGWPPRLDVDPMLSGMWLQMAIRGGFKWFERVSPASNLADRPSRGLAPECPCGYRLREVVDVRRWGLAGRGLPSSARLPSPSLGLLRLGMHTAFGVMRVAPSLGRST